MARKAQNGEIGHAGRELRFRMAIGVAIEPGQSMPRRMLAGRRGGLTNAEWFSLASSAVQSAIYMVGDALSDGRESWRDVAIDRRSVANRKPRTPVRQHLENETGKRKGSTHERSS